MQTLTVSQVQQLADDMPVPVFHGRVEKAWPVKTGQSAHGPWKKQLLLVTDRQQQKICVTAWNHDEVFTEGTVLWFSSKNTTQGWQGLKVRSYTKDGTLVKALDASRSCEISPYPPADASPDDEAGLAAVGLAPAPASAAPAPPKAVAPGPPTDPKAAAMDAVRAAARERNAYVIALCAMNSAFEFYQQKFGEPMPAELFCGGVTSIKISLERAGYVGALPTAPVEAVLPALLKPKNVAVPVPEPDPEPAPDDLIP